MQLPTSDNSNVQIFFNSKSKYKGFAIADTYQRHAKELLKLDGFQYKSRKLAIQLARNPLKLDKSMPPYIRRGIQRGKGHHGNPGTSSENNNIAVRPAPTSSSRQEESHTEPGFWKQRLGVGKNKKRTTNPWHKNSNKNINAWNWSRGNGDSCFLRSTVTRETFPRGLSRMRV